MTFSRMTQKEGMTPKWKNDTQKEERQPKREWHLKWRVTPWINNDTQMKKDTQKEEWHSIKIRKGRTKKSAQKKE